MCSNDEDFVNISDSVLKELIELGRQPIKRIFNSQVILSLTGSEDMCGEAKVEMLSDDQLLIIRNNFFIQEYFFIVYGHTIPKYFVIDHCREERKKIRNHYQPNYDYTTHSIYKRKDNPFEKSRTIKTIVSKLDHKQLSQNIPNINNQLYILFKNERGLKDELELIISQIPCYQLYFSFTQNQSLFNKKLTSKTTSEKLKKWIKFLTSSTNEGDYRILIELCDLFKLQELGQEKINEIKDIVMRSWEFEKSFFQSLLF